MANESPRSASWKLWLILDPRRVLTALFIYLTVIALLIHFGLLSTNRLNWWEFQRGLPAASLVVVPPAVG
ncbi:light-harvesting antenna LH1, alpha subunit [Blastochloris sulfoviridis]|uniref:Light-harvesting protein n=1 Tax=Blastochloris sulfoviridis TaxID=50712 RepID=A0A5M6I4E6_9HYPH|nr:light-harvesting antenna LH1, alpha subunit [Blastochloris sulfoviridis]KAA5603042.1 light-harvesting protein [Blastochloris sulfoviridis]NJO53671.1 light-harvesting protein [Bacteroidales bacterium]